MIFSLALLALSVLVLPASRAGADEEPQPRLRLTRDPGGDGFVVPGRGLWLGADATVKLVLAEVGPHSLELDDVDLLIRYEPTPRLALFTEVALENTFGFQEGAGAISGSGDLSIERLYADWAVTPHLTARVGKFLTPFGLWNVIRRAPLTWTVERPLVTQIFPEHATGLSLIYQTTWHGWSFDATGYGPAQDELAFRRSEESGSRLAGGARVTAAHELGPAYAAVGLSGSGFEDRSTREWANITGADIDVALWGNQLTGEFAYTHLRAPDVSREYGFYLQDAVPIHGSLYGVARIEHFVPRTGESIDNQLLGLFWRPLPHLIIKADYQFTNRPNEDFQRGFVAEFSLFF